MLPRLQPATTVYRPSDALRGSAVCAVAQLPRRPPAWLTPTVSPRRRACVAQTPARHHAPLLAIARPSRLCAVPLTLPVAGLAAGRRGQDRWPFHSIPSLLSLSEPNLFPATVAPYIVHAASWPVLELDRRRASGSIETHGYVCEIARSQKQRRHGAW